MFCYLFVNTPMISECFPSFCTKSCKKCIKSTAYFYEITAVKILSMLPTFTSDYQSTRCQIMWNVYVLVIIWWQSLDGVGEIVGDETRSGYPPPCWLQRRHFWDFPASFSKKYNPDTTRGGQANVFFQSANPKSANSRARSAIANPLIPDVCQSANCKSTDFCGHFYSKNNLKSRLLKRFFVML